MLFAQDVNTAAITAVGGIVVGVIGAAAAFYEKRATARALASKAEAELEEGKNRFIMEQYHAMVAKVRQEYDGDRVNILKVQSEWIVCKEENATLVERNKGLEKTLADRDARTQECEARVRHLEKLLGEKP